MASLCSTHGLYATPSEFVRDLLREKKERQEAAAIRDGVLEGYRDLLSGKNLADLHDASCLAEWKASSAHLAQDSRISAKKSLPLSSTKM